MSPDIQRDKIDADRQFFYIIRYLISATTADLPYGYKVSESINLGYGLTGNTLNQYNLDRTPIVALNQKIN